ncbi:hypothetical protein BGZ60DRAFT_385079 [Tricladium varicosporioides]|nr:hypothetical protein BGZ60DRAFT_385079 [Hymenoscyphus varicosporioides]
MCYQVIQVFECGHNSESQIVRCKAKTPACDEIFLRQELEDVKTLCTEARKAERERLSSIEEDEGYWS